MGKIDETISTNLTYPRIKVWSSKYTEDTDDYVIDYTDIEIESCIVSFNITMDGGGFIQTKTVYSDFIFRGQIDIESSRSDNIESFGIVDSVTKWEGWIETDGIKPLTELSIIITDLELNWDDESLTMYCVPDEGEWGG